MTEEERLSKSDETEYLNDIESQVLEDNDEFDEAPSRPPMVRTRSNSALKVDFCCLPSNVIRCVCANIIAHIQSSENSHYVPPPEYEVFNKEGGSLVHPSSLSCLM
jgi:2-keto-4-pentenoate hydratase/2-oxohepta-3-ene-1,7-dioic acid hydratase in catechol pathway